MGLEERSGFRNLRSNRMEQVFAYDLPRELLDDPICAFSVTVLFTTIPDTLHALRRAAQLAHQLGAGIQILVPYVVPYPLPLDKPRVHPEFRFRQFRTICEQERIATQLDIQLCRDARKCFHDALLPHSLIVIGGKKSWWPLACKNRVARELTRAGHEVIFVRHRA